MNDEDILDRDQAHRLLDEILDNVAEYRRSSVNEPAKGKAIFTLIEALQFVGSVCGKDLLRNAVGNPPDMSDRGAVLACISWRLNLAAFLFDSLEQPGQELISLASSEATCVAKGDEPALFAKLAARKIGVRVEMAKLLSLKWESYLKGVGIGLVTRQSRIAEAFGHPWDTISRWHVSSRQVFDNVDQELSEAVEWGEAAANMIPSAGTLVQWLPFMPTPGENWQEAVVAAGREYKRAREIKVAGV